MARLARLVLPNFPHHLVQKGNNAQSVFLDSNDYSRYIQLACKYSHKYSVDISAYCLMSNHIHILAAPAKENGLAEMMRPVAGLYARYFNKKYGKKGHLWETRFYSSVVEADSYLFCVAQYIELNPVRAGIVTKPEDWRFSSATHHINGVADPLVSAQLYEESEMEQYRKILAEGPEDEVIEEIRSCTSGCKPIGGKRFIARLARKFGIMQGGPSGRPREKWGHSKT